MSPRKQKVIKYFLAIYLIFGILLFVLATNQRGLEINQTGDTIYLKNNTGHKINNVSLFINEDEKLDCISSMDPKTSQKVILPEGNGRVRLATTAPFHNKEEQIIDLQTNSQKLDARINIERDQKKFQAFNVSVEVCNYEIQNKQLEVSEEHNETFFFSKQRSLVFTLEADECKNFIFNYTPQITGETEIKIKVKGLDFQKSSLNKILIGE